MPARPKPVIAVDGPAGAGKSTVARLAARELGYLYLDTGAMYRALALKALKHGVDLRDEEQLVNLLADTTIELVNGGSDPVRVWMDGKEVTGRLRTPEVDASVSQVAGYPAVHEEMVARQRRLARQGGVVMDGRDIGTFVLPDADVKFYLTASLAARAARRQRDLARLGYHVDLESLSEEIRHRDLLDSTRAYSPLRQAEDAIVIDTTDMEVEAVVGLVVERCRERVG